MTIREVSKMTELSQDTLRCYEKAGMIPEVTRTLGGTREHQEEDLKWVQLARA
jgi:Predicted transcriptional regulators